MRDHKPTLIVTDAEIMMVRGDDVELEVQLYDDFPAKTKHEMQTGETLTLTVRRNPKGDGAEPLFQIVGDGTNIKIPGSTTSALPYGAYSADIEFYSPTLGRTTIWPRRAPYEMTRFGAMKNFVIGTEVN